MGAGCPARKSDEHRSFPFFAPVSSNTLSRRAFILASGSLLFKGCAGERAVPKIDYSACAQWFMAPMPAFAKRSRARFPAASLAKLLIAIALIERDPRAVFSKSAIVSAEDFAAHNSFFAHADPGSRLPLCSLLRLMIEQSDDFSANVLIDYLGISAINAAARNLRLAATRINGLFCDVSITVPPHAFTTADDCNIMLSTILRGYRSNPNSAPARAYGALLTMLLQQADRRLIPAAIGSDAQVADKTGEIHGELNDTAIIGPFGPKPLLLTILAKGSFSVRGDVQTYSAAVREVREIAKAIYDRVIRR